MTKEEAVNVLRIMASGIELKGYSDRWILNFREAYEMALKSLENERPQGEWVGANGIYYCSCCKHYAYESQKFDFCQDCGADMRGERQ